MLAAKRSPAINTQRCLKAKCCAMVIAGRCLRQVTRMGNKSGKGPFTPAVIVVRNVMGKKEFNQFRGKAISLHSQSALPASHFCIELKFLVDSDALPSKALIMSTAGASPRK